MQKGNTGRSGRGYSGNLGAQRIAAGTEPGIFCRHACIWVQHSWYPGRSRRRDRILPSGFPVPSQKSGGSFSSYGGKRQCRQKCRNEKHPYVRRQENRQYTGNLSCAGKPEKPDIDGCIFCLQHSHVHELFRPDRLYEPRNTAPAPVVAGYFSDKP